MKRKEKDNESKISILAWTTLVVLGISVLITMYGETMLLPAIPDIIGEFNITYNTSSWILTAYLIAGAVMTPVAGKLSDVYGRKKMVLIILIVYIIGVAIGGWSPNIYVMLVSRVIQGIGISMFPIAFGIIRELLPAQKLAIGVGIFTSMFAAGSVIGLALGGTIVQHLGWRTTFFSILPLGIILWFAINHYVKDHKREQSNKYIFRENENNNKIEKPKTNFTSVIDIKGAILLTVSITSFLLAITYIGNINSLENNHNNSHATNAVSSPNSVIYITLVLISTTVISIILFIIVEKKSSFPLIDLKLFSNKVVSISNILVLTLGLPMFLVYQTIPFLVRSPQPIGFGGNAVEAAIVQLPFMIIFLIFAPASGFIISKIGSIKPVVWGTIFSLIGFIGMFFFHSTEVLVGINLAVIAVGFALLNTGVFNIIMISTPIQYSGISLGMSVVVMIIGMSIGPIVAGFFMQSFQTPSVSTLSTQTATTTTLLSHPSAIAYNLIFVTGIIISTCSIILAFLLRKKLIKLDLPEEQQI
ncbi:MAG: MFS transporter [Candidatus Nitrosocosmicus sp.]